jgi:F0F1-type ATP synthase epsilon subunit
MSQSLLEVIIRDSHRVLYEGTAERVTSWNEVGTFDILPWHTNFVSVIKNQLSLFDDHTKKIEISLIRGVMYVKQNKVQVFLGL